MKIIEIFRWDSWKIKSKTRSAEIRKLRKRYTELLQSRELSKKKNTQLSYENERLKNRILELERELKKS